MGTEGPGFRISLGVRWTGPAGAAAVLHQRSYLGSGVEWPLGRAAGRTDGRTGRAGMRNRAARRAEPGLLNPELGSDKGWAGGRGRGRAGRGQSWAGPGRPLPPQRRSQTSCEWRGPAGAGGRGRGAAGEPMGTWSARPEPPGLEGPRRGRGAGGKEAETQTDGGAAQSAAPEERGPDRLREEEGTRDDGRSDRGCVGTVTGERRRRRCRRRGAGAGGGPGRVNELEMNPDGPVALRAALRGGRGWAPALCPSALCPCRSPCPKCCLRSRAPSARTSLPARSGLGPGAAMRRGALRRCEALEAADPASSL